MNKNRPTTTLEVKLLAKGESITHKFPNRFTKRISMRRMSNKRKMIPQFVTSNFVTKEDAETKESIIVTHQSRVIHHDPKAVKLNKFMLYFKQFGLTKEQILEKVFRFFK